MNMWKSSGIFPQGGLFRAVISRGASIPAQHHLPICYPVVTRTSTSAGNRLIRLMEHIVSSYLLSRMSAVPLAVMLVGANIYRERGERGQTPSPTRHTRQTGQCGQCPVMSGKSVGPDKPDRTDTLS